MSVEELVKESREHVDMVQSMGHFGVASKLVERLSDKLEELAAENARLNLDSLKVGDQMLAEKFRADKAEAALAEAKRENEALREDMSEFMRRLGPRWFLEQNWFPKSIEARNAGGNDEPCRGCGDGDKVPASGYWRCPVCDAEWSGEDAE